MAPEYHGDRYGNSPGLVWFTFGAVCLYVAAASAFTIGVVGFALYGEWAIAGICGAGALVLSAGLFGVTLPLYRKIKWKWWPEGKPTI